MSTMSAYREVQAACVAVQAHCDDAVRLINSMSSAERPDAARRLLRVLVEGDQAVMEMTLPYYGQTIPFVPRILTGYSTIGPEVLLDASFFRAPLAQALVHTIQTGDPIPLLDSTLTWITAIGLGLLAILFIFFGLPVLAAVAVIGAAVIGVVAALTGLVVEAGDNPIGTVSITVIAVAAALAIWILSTRTSFKEMT